MSNWGRGRRVLVLTAVAAAVLVGTASVAYAVAPPKFQLTVTDDFSGGDIEPVVATVPAVVPTGTFKVGLANNSIGPRVSIALGGLPEGMTLTQFMELLDEGPPPPAGVFEAGAVFSKPGQDHQKLFDLTTPGQYGYFFPIETPTGIPHYRLGFIGFFDVAGRKTAPPWRVLPIGDTLQVSPSANALLVGGIDVYDRTLADGLWKAWSWSLISPPL